MTMMSLFRPLTPAELANWTLRIYLRYWPRWIALALLAVIPLALVNLAITAAIPQPELDPAAVEALLESMQDNPLPGGAVLPNNLLEQVVGSSIAALEQAVLSLMAQLILVGVIAGGAGAVMVAAAYNGAEPRFGQALRTGLLERGPVLLRGHLLVGGLLLVMVVASLLGMLVCIGLIGMGLTVYLYVSWVPLLAPVLALEDGAYPLLARRAWRFGKLRVWLLFGAVVTLLALRYVAAIPIGLVAGALIPDPLLAAQIVAVLSEALVLPLGLIFFTVVFLDTRARLDGHVPPGQMTEEAGLATVEPFLTAADMPNLVGVSMAALTLMIAAYFLVLLLASLALPGV